MTQRFSNLVRDLLADAGHAAARLPFAIAERVWDLHRGIHGVRCVEIPSEARSCDIHRHLCEACTSPNELSERIEKALDQKFAAKIPMLRGLRWFGALENRWREAWRKAGLRAGFCADVHALFFDALSERTIGKGGGHEHRIRALEKRRREDVRTLQE